MNFNNKLQFIEVIKIPKKQGLKEMLKRIACSNGLFVIN